jgi:hypothetical protein
MAELRVIGMAQTGWTYFQLEIFWNIPYIARNTIMRVWFLKSPLCWLWLHALFNVRVNSMLLSDGGVTLTSDSMQLSAVLILKYVASKELQHLFYHLRQVPLIRSLLATCPLPSVTCPAVTFRMGKILLTLSLAKERQNVEAVLNTCELFICGDIHDIAK